MATLAIGDIHGSLTALRVLLGELDVERDQLVFLGDYIDRGPDSREVLQTLIDLSADSRHVFLRGNHDDWLLRARAEKSWYKSWISEGVGGKETLRSYGATAFDISALSLIPEEHFAFLDRTRLYFQTDYEIFVHASISWQEPEENDARDLLWPSFDDINPHPSGKRIICGHTSQPNGLPADKDYAVCIDTYAYAGGWLTALNVDTDEVVRADNNGETQRFSLRQRPFV